MALQGKVVIVTGSNTGIGLEAVRALAAEGAKIYMACRDMQKCEEGRDDVIRTTNNHQIFSRQLDLADFASIRKFVREFLEEEEHLHILINNAGIITNSRTVTKQGYETIFGVNHLGHFLLTNRLLDVLKKSQPSRIVVVASDAHKIGTIKFDDINSEKSWSRMRVYAQSKLANILFAHELARQLQGTCVTVNSLHPGVVTTQMTSSAWYFANPIAKLCMKTSKEGAQTTIHLAMSPKLEGVTGKYYSGKKRAGLTSQAKNEKLATRLWILSEEMVAKYPA